jgi:hypothetical protein
MLAKPVGTNCKYTQTSNQLTSGDRMYNADGVTPF